VSGQPDARVDLTGDQRLEEAFALLGTGVEMQHDRVLHRYRADGHLAILTTADDLVEIDEVHERQATAADLRGVAERPQVAALGLGFELLQLVGGDKRVIAQKHRFGRDHLAVDEVLHLLAQGGQLRAQVDGHAATVSPSGLAH